MPWFLGMAGLVLGFATGYCWGITGAFLEGMSTAAKIIREVVCEDCMAKFEKLYDECSKD